MGAVYLLMTPIEYSTVAMYSFSSLYYLLFKMHLDAGDVPWAQLDRLPRIQITS